MFKVFGVVGVYVLCFNVSVVKCVYVMKIFFFVGIVDCSIVCWEWIYVKGIDVC